MKKYSLLASAVVVGTAIAFQGSYVNLQPTSPGTMQTGHSNISGTAKSSSVVAYNNTGTGQTFGGDFRVTSDEGRGVLGNASSATGATYGGLFQSASSGGRGVAGIASSGTGTTYGGFFSSLSSQGRGVYGQATSTSGTTYGVYGKAVSAGGYGVYSEGNLKATGVITGDGGGLTNIPGSAIQAPLILTTDGTAALTATANAVSAQAVTGITSAQSAIGVYGQASGVAGIGVYGVHTGQGYAGKFQSNAGSGALFQGVSVGGYGQGTYGIVGETTAAGSGVHAVGNITATGTKPFRIDDPRDPENRYLMHYATESPFPQNFYNGNVTTDSRGYAWVTLPDYFSDINKNFKYLLTVVDDGEDFVLVKVTKKIADRRFQIRTSRPNVEVSWRIDADRNDRYVQTYPPQDVLLKPKSERGTYQQPELYNQPAEKALFAKERGGN